MKLHCNQRKELENISYQRILEANEKLKVIFNFELLENLSSDDINFVNKMFHRRHLFTHNDGIVDDNYLKKTNDQSLRAGQLVRVKSKEVKRLLDILNKVGEKFWYEFGQFY